MTWVEIAEKVLGESSEPLHSQEIVAKAQQKGLVRPTAKKPDHSLQAAVWRHIREGNDCGFVMVGTGRIGRRYWLKRKMRAGK